jgi:hypothetical protein
VSATVSDHQQRAIEWQRGRIDSLERLLAATKASHDEMARRLQGAYKQHLDEVEAHRMTRGLLAEARGSAAVLAERARCAGEVEPLTEGDCAYGDNCPTFGSRHGRCDSCHAREVLRRIKAGE